MQFSEPGGKLVSQSQTLTQKAGESGFARLVGDLQSGVRLYEWVDNVRVKRLY